MTKDTVRLTKKSLLTLISLELGRADSDIRSTAAGISFLESLRQQVMVTKGIVFHFPQTHADYLTDPEFEGQLHDLQVMVYVQSDNCRRLVLGNDDPDTYGGPLYQITDSYGFKQTVGKLKLVGSLSPTVPEAPTPNNDALSGDATDVEQVVEEVPCSVKVMVDDMIIHADGFNPTYNSLMLTNYLLSRAGEAKVLPPTPDNIKVVHPTESRGAHFRLGVIDDGQVPVLVEMPGQEQAINLNVYLDGQTPTHSINITVGEDTYTCAGIMPPQPVEVPPTMTWGGIPPHSSPVRTLNYQALIRTLEDCEGVNILPVIKSILHTPQAELLKNVLHSVDLACTTIPDLSGFHIYIKDEELGLGYTISLLDQTYKAYALSDEVRRYHIHGLDDVLTHRVCRCLITANNPI